MLGSASMVILLLFGCLIFNSVPAVASADSSMYYMSSRLNEHYPYLATDHDVHTCAETGHSRGSWWVQILPDAINVTSIVVTGRATAYQVRVGRDFKYIEGRGNFTENTLCHFSLALEELIPTIIDCPDGAYGDVISVQAVDPTSAASLVVCEIRVI